MKKLFVLVSVCTLAFALASEAGPRRRQARRIHEGRRSGQLTPDEAKKLREEKRELRKKAREAHADGKITPAERRELRKARRERSRNIHEAKHNDQTTAPAAPAAAPLDAAPAAPATQ